MENVDINELINEYQDCEDSQRKLELSIEIARKYLRLGQFEESRSYAFQGLLLQPQNEKVTPIYDLNSLIGIGYMQQNIYDKANEFLLVAHAIAEKSESTYLIAHGACNLGCLYYSEDNLKEALKYFIQSEHLSESYNYTYLLYSVFLNILRIYIDLNKYDQALHYFNKIVATCKSAHYIAQAHVAIGQLYSAIGNMQTAYYYTKLALKYYQKSDEKYFEVGCLINIADICIARNKLKKVIEFGNKAVAISRECQFNTYLFEGLLLLAIAYTRIKDLEKAGEYFEELKLLESSAEEEMDKDNFRKYYEEFLRMQKV